MEIQLSDILNTVQHKSLGVQFILIQATVANRRVKYETFSLLTFTGKPDVVICVTF